MAGTTAMAGRATRILETRRWELALCDGLTCENSDRREKSFEDVEFEFLEDGEISIAKSSSSDEIWMESDEGDEEEKENNGSVEEDKTFWENQHQLLQATLCRTNSVESRIRNATKEALKEIQATEAVCGCGKKQTVARCRNCLMRRVSGQLQAAGFNSAICKTKWRSSPDIPSGEHHFLDVIDNSSSKKGEMRVIVEPNFRAEFEMARASDDYNRLVRRLPEVFVGKVERLSNLIKILCLAAKKCMKQNKMHMGPWRKQKYMQAKWLAQCERNTSTNSLCMGYSERAPKPTKPKASMLTVDLLEKMPSMHCMAVEVV